MCGYPEDIFTQSVFGASNSIEENQLIKAGNFITYQKAIASVQAYKNKYDKEQYSAFAYSKKDLEKLLTNDATGIIIYDAFDAAKNQRNIILATTSSSINVKTPSLNNTMFIEGTTGTPCPTWCSTSGELSN
jgi:hypothetical protein